MIDIHSVHDPKPRCQVTRDCTENYRPSNERVHTFRNERYCARIHSIYLRTLELYGKLHCNRNFRIGNNL